MNSNFFFTLSNQAQSDRAFRRIVHEVFFFCALSPENLCRTRYVQFSALERFFFVTFNVAIERREGPSCSHKTVRIAG